MHAQGAHISIFGKWDADKAREPTASRSCHADVSNTCLLNSALSLSGSRFGRSKMASGQARMFRASLIPLGPLPRNSVGCGCRYQNTSGDSSVLPKGGVTQSPILLKGDKRPKLNTV
jgi:hypothetical protein